MSDQLIYTWEEFFRDAEVLAKKVKPLKSESLLVITRGGMFLGGLLSEYLSIPFVETIAISSYKDDEQQVMKILKPSKDRLDKILIVDDISDTGTTLKYVTELYKAPSVCLFKKPDTKQNPTFYLHETTQWVKFPWEVEEVE